MLLIIVSGDKGFAGAFNANILKTAFQFINGNPDKEIDVEAVGRKARDLMRRRYPAAVYTERTDDQGNVIQSRERKAPVEVAGDHPGMLLKLEKSRVLALAESIIARYAHEEIDAAYIVYNEFKSVIAQRLVVEKLLPLMKIGIAQISGSTEPTAEEKERAAEAALSAGIEIEAVDTAEADEEAKKFGTSSGGLHLRAALRGAFCGVDSAVHFVDALSRDDGVGGCGKCGAHDGDGFGNQQRLGDDRLAHAAYESRAPGGHHQGDH